MAGRPRRNDQRLIQRHDAINLPLGSEIDREPETMRHLILAAGVCLAAGDLRAEHYFQTADPQLLQAVNEMIYVLGQGCQVGNALACQAIPDAQHTAHVMFSAGYDCQTQGNRAACDFYRQNIAKVEQMYGIVAQAHQTGALYQPSAGAGGMVNPLGETHEDRMQQIHNWGQERLDFGVQSQAILDQRHADFMANF
jgi:hypothetical protein